MTELEQRHSIDAVLEVREGGRILRGRFPYERMATISDRGRVRKETFSINAFRYSLEEAKAKRARIDLLQGHDFNRPLANTIDDTIEFSEIPTPNGGMDLVFEATLPVVARQPQYMQDTVAAVRAGLMKGLSPGFRVPPLSVVKDAEVLEPERGNPGVQIRRINQGVLYEMSVVTRGAYGDAEVENRQDIPVQNGQAKRRLWLWL